MFLLLGNVKCVEMMSLVDILLFAQILNGHLMVYLTLYCIKNIQNQTLMLGYTVFDCISLSLPSYKGLPLIFEKVQYENLTILDVHVKAY